MTALPQGQNLCDVSVMTPLSFLCAGLKLSLAVLSPEAKVRVRTLAARRSLLRPMADGSPSLSVSATINIVERHAANKLPQ